MLAITILQPWAQLIVCGCKRFETRTWQTNHRGQVLIHAGRRFMDAAKQLSTLEPFFSALAEKGWKPPNLPLGAIVGMAEIESCQPTTELLHNKLITDTERQFGDFRPGRQGWKLVNPTVFPQPIKYNGNRGLFEIPDTVLQEAGIQVPLPITVPVIVPPTEPRPGELKCA